MASSCPEALGPVTEPAPEPERDEREREPWEFVLRNPPGGIWQENAAGHLAGEPIVRSTNNLRYLVFFYCNAFALASSVLVIVVFLLLSIDLIENKKKLWMKIRPLRVLMVLDLISFMGAYAAGSCRDMLTTVYTSVLMVAGVSTYLTVQVLLACGSHPKSPLPANQDKITVKLEERLHKVLILLATFAAAALWENTWGGHRLGDAILNDSRHKARLATFFVCNTTAFMASLLIIMLLLGRKLHERKTVQSREMFGCVVAVLVGLVGAYAAGSCRETGTTVYVVLVVVAGLVCILLRIRSFFQMDEQPSAEIVRVSSAPAEICVPTERHVQIQRSPRSFLLLLATFATAITYQAGLDPPGGVWQDDNGHVAGDPILLTTNAIRHRIFFYCNSVAFVASLVTIILFLFKTTFRRLRVVKTLMILEFFGLIGGYVAGAVLLFVVISTYVIALGGAVLLFVVIYVICFRLVHVIYGHELPSHHLPSRFRKKGRLLYLFATLSTAMSYQAGLNPPAGFWPQDDDEHAAGNPVLLYNHPSRYNVFCYCNSLSFMLSVTTMILLMNPVLYRAALRSYALASALTVCTVAGLSCLMGAYATGSTQHFTTSIGIFVLVAVVVLILVVLLLVFLVRDHQPEETPDVARNTGASIIMLLLLLLKQLHFLKQQRQQRLMRLEWPLHIKVMRTVVMFDMLALLVAYAVGSTRDWKSSLSVGALVISVLAIILIKVCTE
uniref:PGG domain-containing protein n=1 Tax=Aegilops tauschii TaxID=37682 RepID=M8BK92_AEGTA